MKIFIKLLVISSSETSYLKVCISVTGKKYAKNASTGPNKFNVQYHYAPELSIYRAYSFCCIWQQKNMVVIAGAEQCTG